MQAAATITLDSHIRQRPAISIRIRRIMARHPNLLVGTILLTLVVLSAIFAPIIMNHSATLQNPSDRLLAPGREYWLGTDGQGRDVYSRTIKASQLSLFVGVAVSVLTMAVGGVIGLASGFM
ncbi:MAG TPA: hypothetical protein VNZ58_13030, partial [Thermomicrobiales bacterium]|nr:hypothetical protein [Thermomicrobiales bacterium]